MTEHVDLEGALDRAQKLDLLRAMDDRDRATETPWIVDEMKKLWDSPDLYEDDPDALYDVPNGVRGEDYVLFRLGVAFGCQYEHKYPAGKRDEWEEDDG